MKEYIEREAALERLKFKRDNDDWNNSKYRGLECAIAQVQKAPTADVVEVRHGEWVHSSRGFDVRGDYECSLCRSPEGIKHFYRGEPHYAYCPNCGAKMDGKGE